MASSRTHLTRRTFLAGIAGTAATAILAACGGNATATPGATTAPTKAASTPATAAARMAPPHPSRRPDVRRDRGPRRLRDDERDDAPPGARAGAERPGRGHHQCSARQSRSPARTRTRAG